MSNPAPEFKTRLQQVLQEEGRKQRWLAEQIGVDEAMVSRYASGLHVPDDKQRLIARALRRRVRDVFPPTAEAA